MCALYTTTTTTTLRPYKKKEKNNHGAINPPAALIGPFLCVCLLTTQQQQLALLFALFFFNSAVTSVCSIFLISLKIRHIFFSVCGGSVVKPCNRIRARWAIRTKKKKKRVRNRSIRNYVVVCRSFRIAFFSYREKRKKLTRRGRRSWLVAVVRRNGRIESQLDLLGSVIAQIVLTAENERSLRMKVMMTDSVTAIIMRRTAMTYLMIALI